MWEGGRTTQCNGIVHKCFVESVSRISRHMSACIHVHKLSTATKQVSKVPQMGEVYRAYFQFKVHPENSCPLNSHAAKNCSTITLIIISPFPPLRSTAT